MFDINKLSLLEQLNKLVESIHDNNTDFPKFLCSFINKELSVPTSMLIGFSADKHISILGYDGEIKLDFNKSLLVSNLDNIKKEVEANISLNGVKLFKDNEIATVCRLSSDNSGSILLILLNEQELTDKEVKLLPDVLKYISHLYEYYEKSGTEKSNVQNIVQKSLQELRTPVNSIIGFTSILSEESMSSSQAEYLSTIKSNAQNILLNVNDLLDYIKICSSQTKMNRTQISLNLLVKQIVEVFKNKFSDRLSSLEFLTNNSNELKINGDDQKLRFAINNVLNYLTMAVEKPEIKINLESDNNSSINLSINIISDKTDLSKLYKIFDPFSFSDQSNKEISFSDLALTLSREYIKSNDGDVKLSSSGKSSFKIEVLFGGKPKEIENQLSALPKPTNDNNAILVIEDDYATSKLLSNYLTKWGYTPTVINTAEQALELIEKHVYLAVIMDIALPNVNGLELLKQINSHPKTKNTPVIVCSIETEQQKAFLMGAVEYFVKPINYNFLVEVLTSYKLRKESNILCVDDDVPTLNLLKQAVETAGFNAIAEHISANVMDLIREKSIDLAIIDLDMPHPNGFELIKIIKSDSKYQNLPIIIYTGKENFTDDLKQIDGMFEDLLSKKSTNLEDLSGIISSMINRYEEPVPAEKISETKDGVKILFAEDYKHSQIIVTRLLKKNNFSNIVVVENGEEALNLAQKEKFDLILMDMQMPVMNGFEATEKIKKLPDYQNTPIIALTAFAMKGDREKCLEAGATDYIPKPIDSKEFLEKVKYYTSTV